METANEVFNDTLLETPETFWKKVDDLVWDQDITYLEATVKIAEDNEYEPERVAKLVAPVLKAKIEEEASSLNLIEKKNTLDI